MSELTPLIITFCFVIFGLIAVLLKILNRNAWLYNRVQELEERINARKK